MTGYNQGDIILIPFPFTDFSTFKQRPAVVISSDHFNQTHQDVIVAAITSHIPDHIAEDEYLLSVDELKPTGLPKASLIKLGKIVTIDQRLIRKRLGALPEKTPGKIILKLHKVVGSLSV